MRLMPQSVSEEEMSLLHAKPIRRAVDPFFRDNRRNQRRRRDIERGIQRRRARRGDL